MNYGLFCGLSHAAQGVKKKLVFNVWIQMHLMMPTVQGYDQYGKPLFVKKMIFQNWMYLTWFWSISGIMFTIWDPCEEVLRPTIQQIMVMVPGMTYTPFLSPGDIVNRKYGICYLLSMIVFRRNCVSFTSSSVWSW